MSRYLAHIVPVLLLAAAACGSSEARLNAEGNVAFAENDLQDSIRSYKRAQVESPDLAEPYYNAANAFYKQEAYDSAQSQMEQALRTAGEPLAESGFFNVGNSHFQAERYDQAIEAYKEALRLNPGAPDAKHNLELALEKLQEQQQQQAGPQDSPEQEGAPGEQPQPEQGDQDGGEPEGDRQQTAGQNQPPRDQTPDDGQQEQPQTDGLTEEQARRLLDAAAQDTRTLQEHLELGDTSRAERPAQDY